MNTQPKIKKADVRQVKETFTYVSASHHKHWVIPAGSLCIKATCLPKVGGKWKWFLYETPQAYLHDEQFLSFARNVGIQMEGWLVEPTTRFDEIKGNRVTWVAE
jgi:hypothetical protein